MIIGPDFVWLHFPKCAGTFTEKLIRTLDADSGKIAFDTIDPSKIIWHQGVTERENITGENLQEKKIISNFRRLPTWIISRIQFETNRSGNRAIKELYSQGCFYEQNGNINFADRILQKYGIPRVNQWLRVESLKEDFRKVFSSHFDCGSSAFDALFSEKINVSGWKGDIRDWFEYEDLVTLYASNPNWTRLEYWLYGNLMVDLRDLKPWPELHGSELVKNDGDCLFRFTGLARKNYHFVKLFASQLMHPRLRSFLKGNGQALYFFRTTLVHSPGAEVGSGDGDSQGEVAVRPVLAKPQHGVEYSPKNKRKVTRKRDSKPGTPEKLGPRIPGFPDHCPNCFEINMNSVEKFIQDTRQIRDLTRNESGLAFTVTGNEPYISFKPLEEKIPWVALYLDLSLPAETTVKLYYRSSADNGFGEHDFYQVIAGPGRQLCRMELPSRKGIEAIRILPGENPGNYILHRVIAEI